MEFPIDITRYHRWDHLGFWNVVLSFEKFISDLPRTKNWGMPPPSGYSKISSLLRYWKESDLKMYILQIERFLEKDSYGKISIFNCVVFLSKNNLKKKKKKKPPPKSEWARANVSDGSCEAKHVESRNSPFWSNHRTNFAVLRPARNHRIAPGNRGVERFRLKIKSVKKIKLKINFKDSSISHQTVHESTRNVLSRRAGSPSLRIGRLLSGIVSSFQSEMK